MDNEYQSITMNKDTLCVEIEEKERLWKRTSIILAIIIVIFCALLIYGYIIAANYNG